MVLMMILVRDNDVGSCSGGGGNGDKCTYIISVCFYIYFSFDGEVDGVTDCHRCDKIVSANSTEKITSINSSTRDLVEFLWAVRRKKQA